MGRHDISFDVAKGLEALDIIKSLLLADGMGDDEEARQSAIASETNLIELLDRLMIEDAEMEADIKKCKALASVYDGRAAMFTKRRETRKALFEVVMGRIDMKSIAGPYGTLIRRINPENIEVFSEPDVDMEFWKTQTTSTIDRAELKKVYLQTRKLQLEAIEKARLPFLLEMVAAESLPETEQKIALAAIEERMTPALALVEADLPLPSGVRMAETTYSAFVKR